MPFIKLLIALLPGPLFAASEPLGSYNVDPQTITVSGVSSGAFMAVQMQVAFSSIIAGSASVAGGPYWCAEGNPEKAPTQCMSRPDRLRIAVQIQEARRLAAAGQIDDPALLAKRRLYAFASANDQVTKIGTTEKLVDFYAAFTGRQKIRFEQNSVAGHGFPTLNYGEPCANGRPPWILKCGLDTAGEILKAMYGALLAPTAAKPEHLRKFSQSPFGNAQTPLHTGGWIYVPAVCAKGQRCKLHIALHGCQMNPDFIQDQFARHSGYNEWAESNGLIVLYPQSAKLPEINPFACWDWFGFTGKNYVTQSGAQMTALRSMIRKVSGL